jgi:hypothetical protein
MPSTAPDPLADVLRRALEKPPELVPGLERQPYRSGDVERARLRRKYRR